MQAVKRYLWAIYLLLAISAGPLHADALNFSADSRQRVENLTAVTGATALQAGALNGKPVLVTFFASWCPPCLEEFSHLNKLAHKYQATDLRIVAINVFEAWDDNDAARMQKFIETTRPLFPAVVGSEAIRDMFGGIDRIPTVIGFDRQGNPGYRFTHKRGSKKTNATFAELDQAAQRLLGIN